MCTRELTDWWCMNPPHSPHTHPFLPSCSLLKQTPPFPALKFVVRAVHPTLPFVCVYSCFGTALPKYSIWTTQRKVHLGSCFLGWRHVRRLWTALQARKWSPGQAMSLKVLPENLGLFGQLVPTSKCTAVWRVRGLEEDISDSNPNLLVGCGPRTWL